ncbi:MAG: hypothetical protein GY807_16920 [Gammaproteobacteria bacterium]|nr:hypothetical protein [Gammaproteobacteria bacterium]
MSFRNSSLSITIFSILLGAGCSSEPEPPKISYQQGVAPILEYYCKECHVAGQEGASKSGFIMDSYETVMKGTKLGPIIVAGSAESSTLYRLVAGKADPSIKMPHGTKSLTDDEIDTIKLWIDQGASES